MSIYSNGGGLVTSLGYNISSDDGSGILTGPGDQTNTDPMLGPLQDNGGSTFTHAFCLAARLLMPVIRLSLRHRSSISGVSVSSGS